jgi:4'-phosphopantetheinyl transferase
MSGMPDAISAVTRVWWLDPRHLPERSADMLAPDERLRLTASRDPRDVQRRTAAGVLLRCVVASLLGQRPHEVRVSRRCPHCPAPHGRPELPGSPLRVSVSHAGDRVAVAVTDRGAVGVDVEAPRARALSRALLRRALTADEQEYLLGVSEDRRRSEFLRAWTAKEAILKATGLGVLGGLDRLDLDLSSRPVRLRSWAGSTGRAGTVRLVELDPGNGHVATLATIGGEASAVSQREGRTLVERITP